ncbi:MAG: hypothetical protein IJZ73_03145 [Clostridia bacterium]|nr:hypothetical protein [Clostridia bacterium]
MKRKFLYFIVTLLLLISLVPFAGCDLFAGLDDRDGDDGDTGGLPQIDNSIDLSEFTPPTDDDYEYIDGEIYYNSSSIDLVTEINGNYTIDRPFTLDKENENKRIYHNIYFYVEDFFQVIYYKKITDLGTIYASLSDSTDQEYASVEYTSKGNPLQINIIKQGVYNLILDVETFAIDMVKVKDIDTPVYETIKSCELNVHVSLDDHTYTPMSFNSATNEYFIEKTIPRNSSIGFYSESHNSHYKMTVENTLKDRLIYYNTNNVQSVRVHVGGTYKVYFNAKTYVLRLELLSPETANYFCQVGWQGTVLSPKNENTPYLFEHTLTASAYDYSPTFYPELGMRYTLTVIGDEEDVSQDSQFRQDGTYKLTVNLLDFTLTVEKVA